MPLGEFGGNSSQNWSRTSPRCDQDGNCHSLLKLLDEVISIAVNYNQYKTPTSHQTKTASHNLTTLKAKTDLAYHHVFNAKTALAYHHV